jgi:hypothetical protein
MERFSVEYPESYKKYLEYLESDDEFEYQVRMEHEWDDEKYQELLKLLMDVINDYKPTDLIPRSVMHFFTSGITRLTGMISHPDFLNNRTIKDLKAYQELVNKRKNELLELQKKFISGELFQED